MGKKGLLTQYRKVDQTEFRETINKVAATLSSDRLEEVEAKIKFVRRVSDGVVVAYSRDRSWEPGLEYFIVEQKQEDEN